MRARFYLGHSKGARVVFKSDTIPTPDAFPQFAGVVGPFRTKRAALWAAAFGWNNPHYRHVGDAERLSQRAD